MKNHMQASVHVNNPLGQFDTSTTTYAAGPYDGSVRETQTSLVIAGITFIWSSKVSYEQVKADLNTIRNTLDDTRAALGQAQAIDVLAHMTKEKARENARIFGPLDVEALVSGGA
jgi:hypothetical protein